MTGVKFIPFSLMPALCALLLQGCTTVGPNVDDSRYAVLADNSVAGRYAPIVVPGESGLSYNRIGHAAARLDDAGEEQVYIADAKAAFYWREQPFTAASGQRYRNLIYRFHFPRVPQPHLTAGANGGLFAVITLDDQERPVLITTVHTCGCYLAFVPTSYLADAAYPAEWPVDSQDVFGETLPARLNYPLQFDEELRPVISLRSATHRVMNIELGRSARIDASIIPVELQSAAALERLPLGAGYTSFFHQSGWLKGYVKDSFKPWELMLMSWWALDLNIGRDKQLDDPVISGTVFYTSLKPWAREESNMYFFAEFLDYWGWRL